jgi:uncharacterized membrane protein (Fun14 family)
MEVPKDDVFRTFYDFSCPNERFVFIIIKFAADYFSKIILLLVGEKILGHSRLYKLLLVYLEVEDITTLLKAFRMINYQMKSNFIRSRPYNEY